MDELAALRAAEDRIYRLCEEATELVQRLYRRFAEEKGEARQRYGEAVNRAAARGDRRHQAWRAAWLALTETQMVERRKTKEGGRRWTRSR